MNYLRKGLFGLGILILLCHLSFAQRTDSVTQVGSQLLYEADSLFRVHPPTADTDQQAISKFREAISFLLDSDDYVVEVAEAHQKIGNILEMRGDLAGALVEYQESYHKKRRLFGPLDTLFLTDYLYIGNIYLYQEKYDSCNHYYDKAERIASQHLYVKESESVFNSMGVLHSRVGNYRKALTYYEKTLAILKKHSVYSDSRVRMISNIAFLKSKLGRYDEAIADYNTIAGNDLKKRFYQNMGAAHLGMKQYDSAKFFLKESLQTRQIVNRIVSYNSLARVYLEEKHYDSSHYCLSRSIAINQDNLAHRNTYLASAYSGLAQLQQARNNPDSTLHYYQLALINTTFDFNDPTITENPTDITQAISLLQLFDVLKGKAAAWNQYYQQDQDITKLNHALATYQLAIRVAQHVQKTYDNDEAKLFLVNKVAPVYEEAITTAVQLHQLTDDPAYVAQAFQFSEASKAAVLTESLRDVKIKTSGAVNDSLVQDEHRLKQLITALRLKLVESQDSAQNEVCRQQLIDQEIALARTVKYLQQDEHYYRRKYQPDSLDIAALQRSLLNDGETLLEYFVGKAKVYLFALRRSDLQVATVTRTAQLDSALQRTRRHLYAYRPGQGEDTASLATLYRYLIAPVADAVDDARKLIVVPDGPLHYLPFDLLSVDGQRANYLLHSHALHYGYSASLLRQAIDERRGYPTESVLAMAPFAGGAAGNVRSQGFSPLRDSQAEVESVGGSIYTEGQATKRRFLRVAGSYNVLHLATHATVDADDPSQSFIAFYPQQRDSVANYRLYTHELYNMRLDSVKLVVLSACEAGNGQLVRGEGVMSLARAFAYAGCPNIVTTLWKADDRSSARLTTRLHHYLKQGWGKDKALRQAKLDYLNDPEVHPAQKAPYYWANFIFIGDPVPIYDNHQWWWLVAGLVLLVIMAGGTLLWQRWKREGLKQLV